MPLSQPVSASPLAVQIDRDALRAAMGRDTRADAKARLLEAAIVGGLVDAALEAPLPPQDDPLDLDEPSPGASRIHAVALVVALVASIVLMTLAG